MENLDKYDPDLLDDEEYEPLMDGDRRAAEIAMQERDLAEGRIQGKSLSLAATTPSSSESDEEEEEKADSGKKQTTMFSFFKKVSKPTNDSATLAVSTLKAKAEAQAISHKMSATKGSSLEAGSLVWAKLQGYPWWPGLLFMHKGMLERKVEGQRELNVWFLGENSRSWVAKSMVRVWGQEVDRSQGEADKLWRKGLKEAEEAVELTQEERLAKMLPEEEETESEEESEDEDEETKESETKIKSPPKKRRRIVMAEDSDSESEDEKFEVEKILESKEKGGTTKYLVKWVGYDKEEDNTWEPVENLDCKEKIRLFEDKLDKVVFKEESKVDAKLVKDEKPELSAPAC